MRALSAAGNLALITFAAISVLICTTHILGDFFFKSLERASKPLDLVLKEVLIEGRENCAIEKINLIFNQLFNQSLLTISLPEIRDKLKEVSWVDSATIVRLPPNKVRVSLIERKPIARWKSNSGVFIVDGSGKIIEASSTPKFQDLPLITGEGANEKAPAILAAFDDFCELKKKVEVFELVHKYRWNLVLNNSVTVKLPEANVRQALRRLQNFLSSHSLVFIKTVDLRWEGRVILLGANLSSSELA